MFDLFELSKTDSAKLEKILGFILYVYVPIFASVKMKPRVPDAPNIVLRSRDLMKQYGVLESIKTVSRSCLTMDVTC